MIRHAQLKDAAVICAIWNPVIRDTLITFNPVVKTQKSVRELLKEKSVRKEPFFLATEQDQVLGFATYGQFRGGQGYRHTMEHTIILAPDARGKGIGRALMQAIEDHARFNGAYSMMAGVSGANPDGAAFHQRLGYIRIATLPQVGRKFDRWLDLILLQKIL